MTRIIHSRLIRWILANRVFFPVSAHPSPARFSFCFFHSGRKRAGRAAFWMGFRYDARWVCGFLMIVWIAGIFISLNHLLIPFPGIVTDLYPVIRLPDHSFLYFRFCTFCLPATAAKCQCSQLCSGYTDICFDGLAELPGH